MMSESRMHAEPVAQNARALTWMRNLMLMVVGTLVVAVCAHVAVPLSLTPVPLTLQGFAVLLLGMLFPPRLAFATMAAYLLEGVLGLAVFTPGPAAGGGLAQLVGPTGGYLLAYPFAAAWMSSLWRSHKRSFVWGLISVAMGDLLIVVVGAVWLHQTTHASLEATLLEFVIPFLPGDALKVVAVAGIAAEWQRWRRPSRIQTNF